MSSKEKAVINAIRKTSKILESYPDSKIKALYQDTLLWNRIELSLSLIRLGRALVQAIKHTIICHVVGHKWTEGRTIFLPCRVCIRCGHEQVRVPFTGSHKGGWVDRLTGKGWKK